MPRGESGQQPTTLEDIKRPLSPVGGSLSGHRSLQRAILKEAGGECHAGTGIDHHGHAGWKNNLVFSRPLEIKESGNQGRHGAEPQGGQEQTDAAREFRCIPPIHPGNPRRHRHQSHHQQRHLPPLRESIDQRACDAMLDASNGGHQRLDWAGNDGECSHGVGQAEDGRRAGW